MVFERCRTARGSVRMTDWNRATGIRSTWQRVSAIRSANVLSPLISAIFAERVTGLEAPEYLALAAVRHDRSRQFAFQEHAQKARFFAELEDGLMGFAGHHTQPLDQIVQTVCGQILKQADLASEETQRSELVSW